MPPPSFSGFYAPTSYLVVLLEVFTIALFACAVAAEYLGTIFERLHAHSVMARTEAERGQELWVSLVERLPLPALLIDPDTLQIAATSEFAIKYLQGADVALEGRNLFDAVQFSYPDFVQELVVGAGAGSGAPLTAMRVSGELRLARLRVLHVVHKGRRMALLTIEDATEVFCLKAALDTSEYASLVVDARGRVRAFNKPIVDLFGSVEIGADAVLLLHQPNAGPRWWEPGSRNGARCICKSVSASFKSRVPPSRCRARRRASSPWRFSRSPAVRPIPTRTRPSSPARCDSCDENSAPFAPCIALLLASSAALGQASTADDRIAASANGSTLTGTNGGAGASLAFLHNFDAATLLAGAVEYQALSVAHWSFGSVNGAMTRGPDDQRYTFSGEVHEGAGDDGPRSFHYHIEAVGVAGTYFHKLSALLEDKRIDVETSHGNLPKFGLSYLWGPTFRRRWPISIR